MGHVLEQEERAQTELRSQLALLASFDVEKLKRADVKELKGIDFPELSPLIEEIIDCAKDALVLNLDHVPYQVLRTRIDAVQESVKLLTEIEKFAVQSATEEYFNDMRNKLWDVWRSRLASTLSGLFSYGFRNSALTDTVSALNQSVVATEQTLRELEVRRDALFEWQSKMIESINQSNLRGQQVTEEIRALISDAAVAHYATKFSKNSEHQEKQALEWLHNAGVAGYVLFAIAIFFCFTEIGHDVEHTGKAIALVSNKLLLVSVVSLGLFMCLKNYAACKHNALVNQHRSDALLTFVAFKDAAGEDEDTKKAVLLQAMQGVFSVQPTGYLKGGAEVQSGPQIVEFIKNTVGKTE